MGGVGGVGAKEHTDQGGLAVNYSEEDTNPPPKKKQPPKNN